jgi:hypothetical protein
MAVRRVRFPLHANNEPLKTGVWNFSMEIVHVHIYRFLMKYFYVNYQNGSESLGLYLANIINLMMSESILMDIMYRNEQIV